MKEFKVIICLLIISICVMESWAGVIKRDTVTVEEAKENLDQLAKIETEAVLNSLFNAQIKYFEGLKNSLPPNTQRVTDIEDYIEHMKKALNEKTLKNKDHIWMDTFKKFNKSPLLLNKEEETGLNDDAFNKVIVDSGLTEVVKNFLADLAAYFWKIAKASGKVIEITVDDYLENVMKDRNNVRIF